MGRNIDFELLDFFFEKSPMGMALRDSHGGFYRVNEKFTEITGYNFSDLVNLSYKQLFEPTPGITENLLTTRIQKEAMENWQGEFRYIHKTGRIIQVKQKVVHYKREAEETIYSEKGNFGLEQVDFFLVILEDVTANKKSIQREIEITKNRTIRNLSNNLLADLSKQSEDMLQLISTTPSRFFGLGGEEILFEINNLMRELEEKSNRLKTFCRNISEEISNTAEENWIEKNSLKDLFSRVALSLQNLKQDSNIAIEWEDCLEDEIVSFDYSDLFQIIWNIYLLVLYASRYVRHSKIILRREVVDDFIPPGDVWLGRYESSGFLISLEWESENFPYLEVWIELIQGSQKNDEIFSDKMNIIKDIISEKGFGFGLWNLSKHQSLFMIFLPHIHNRKAEGISSELSTLPDYVVDPSNSFSENQLTTNIMEAFSGENKPTGLQYPLEILFVLDREESPSIYLNELKDSQFTVMETVVNDPETAISLLEKRAFHVVIYKQPNGIPIDIQFLSLVKSINQFIPVLIHANDFDSIINHIDIMNFQYGFFTNLTIKLLPYILKRDIEVRRIIRDKEVIQDNLKSQYSFYEKSLQSISDIMVIYDLESQEIVYLNNIVEKIFGYSIEEMKNLQFRSSLIHPDDSENVLLFFQNLRTAQENKFYKINYRMKNKKGKFRYLENLAQVLEFNYQGKAKKILSTIRDRTDYFRYLESMNESVKKTRSSDQSKTKFLANISHELKTPLNSILGYSEFLLMPGMANLTDQQKLYIDTIYSNGKYLLNLMDQILDYSKSELDQFKINRESVDLDHLIKTIIDSYLIIAKSKHIKILYDCWVELPRMSLDPIRIREVLSNLINNAIKFSDEGTEISIRTSKDTYNYKIEVEDQGRGIAEDDKNRIFEPFEQVQQDQNVKNDGIGLGLSICKKIIEMHGGRLSFESELGKGTCFQISLPMVQYSNSEG